MQILSRNLEFCVQHSCIKFEFLLYNSVHKFFAKFNFWLSGNVFDSWNSSLIGRSNLTKCNCSDILLTKLPWPGDGSPPLRHFFERSSAARAQWRGDAPASLLHALMNHSEYNKRFDLKFLKFLNLLPRSFQFIHLTLITSRVLYTYIYFSFFFITKHYFLQSLEYNLYCQ